MSKSTLSGSNLESLMDKLSSKDGMIRQKARESLVALGKPAVSSLTDVLQNSTSDQVRWEAAKALGAIGDTSSIPSLVKALSDSNDDVVWLAAEAWPESVLKGSAAVTSSPKTTPNSTVAKVRGGSLPSAARSGVRASSG